jgi:hypothetical protein
MVQAQPAKDQAQDVGWVEDRDGAKAEWVNRLPQVRVETVYARTVVQQMLMLSDNLVIKEAVQNVEQK